MANLTKMGIVFANVLGLGCRWMDFVVTGKGREQMDLEKIILEDIKKLPKTEQLSLIKNLLSTEGWLDWLWLVAGKVVERERP